MKKCFCHWLFLAVAHVFVCVYECRGSASRVNQLVQEILFIFGVSSSVLNPYVYGMYSMGIWRNVNVLSRVPCLRKAFGTEMSDQNQRDSSICTRVGEDGDTLDRARTLIIRRKGTLLYSAGNSPRGRPWLHVDPKHQQKHPPGKAKRLAGSFLPATPTPRLSEMDSSVCSLPGTAKQPSITPWSMTELWTRGFLWICKCGGMVKIENHLLIDFFCNLELPVGGKRRRKKKRKEGLCRFVFFYGVNNSVSQSGSEDKKCTPLAMSSVVYVYKTTGCQIVARGNKDAFLSVVWREIFRHGEKVSSKNPFFSHFSDHKTFTKDHRNSIWCVRNTIYNAQATPGSYTGWGVTLWKKNLEPALFVFGRKE